MDLKLPYFNKYIIRMGRDHQTIMRYINKEVSGRKNYKKWAKKLDRWILCSVEKLEMSLCIRFCNSVIFWDSDLKFFVQADVSKGFLEILLNLEEMSFSHPKLTLKLTKILSFDSNFICEDDIKIQIFLHTIFKYPEVNFVKISA